MANTIDVFSGGLSLLYLKDDLTGPPFPYLQPSLSLLHFFLMFNLYEWYDTGIQGFFFFFFKCELPYCFQICMDMFEFSIVFL